MKKLIVLTIMAVLLALTAQAMTISSPTIGDEDQDRVVNVSSTFTVKNDDTANALTNVQLSSTAPGSYNVAFSPSSIASIAPGASETVTVTATIPDDHDGIDSNFEPNPLVVGQIQGTGTLAGNSDTDSANLQVQAVNHLRIDKVRVECDTKSKSVDDGDKVDNILPGENCNIEITIENRFDDRTDQGEKITDVTFRDVNVRMDSNNGDVDVDIDDEPSDIDPEDEDTADGTIEVDPEADRDARVTIEVEAIDDNGAKHGEKLEFEIEVKRLRHDVQIRQADANPNTLDNCEAQDVRINVNVRNMGKRDEDEAAVEINVPDLQYVDKETPFQLDVDDSRTVVFDVPVPEGADAGLYQVDIETFFDTLASSNLGKVEFTVTECELPDESGDSEDDNPVIVVKNTSTQAQSDSVRPPASASAAQAAPSRSSSTPYVALLIVLNVLLFAGIIAIAIMFAMKKK